MRIASQSDAQEHEPIRVARFRGARKSTLAAAALAISAIAAAALTAARAEAPHKDLWQTYMEAAAASDQTEDFDVEAIALNAAIAHAKKHNSGGLSMALAHLPLMLAYGELGREDLVKVLIAEGTQIDIANPEKRYEDFIKTIDDYASSYYSRWDQHASDSDFKQQLRTYGVQNSYLIEVALLTTLRPEDKATFAEAMKQVGAVYKKRGNLECATYDYARAYEMFRELQQVNAAMAWSGTIFSVEDLTSTTRQQNMMSTTKQQSMMGGPAVLDSQVWLAMSLGLNQLSSAYKMIHPPSGSRSEEKTDLDQCDRFGPPATAPTTPASFDAKISQAAEYFDAALELAKDLHEHWQYHPLFGILEFRWADLYGAEFEMTQLHPDQYPDSLANAKDHYAKSLSILTRAAGTNSPFVHTIATSYVQFLIEAKLNDDAKKIEEQYGVVPDN